MDDIGWDKIVDAIDTKFGLSDHGHFERPLEDRADLNQSVRFICFTKGGQDYKLERITGPAIIDRKSHYSRTAGSGTRFENVYDPEETSHKTVMYKKNGEAWDEIDPSELSL